LYKTDLEQFHQERWSFQLIYSPTHSPVQWVLEANSPRVKGVKLTSNLHLVSRLRIRGAILPLPHTLFSVVLSYLQDTSSWHGAYLSKEQFYF